MKATGDEVKTPRDTEKGQVLILLVLSMVALLGFAALAIDGGMTYSDRRHAQEGADAASLAGGAAIASYFDTAGIDYMTWSCSGSYGSASMDGALTNAEDAAMARAEDNGYTLDRDPADLHGVDATCHFDPLTPARPWDDKYIEIMTRVTRETDTSFIHFVYDGPVRNSVEAITKIRPRTPSAFGNAIVALNDSGCSGNQNGVIFGGSIATSVTGGGIFSNGCLGANGNAFNVSTAPLNPGDPTPPIIYQAGNLSPQISSRLDQINPDPIAASQTLPESSYLIEPPNCSGLPTRSMTGNSPYTLQPGVYDRIAINNNDRVTMAPGLYCITGSQGFKMNGGELTAHGVTIYIKNNSGSFSVSGGIADIQAPGESPDPYPALPNVVLYSNASGDAITLSGNGGSSYLGTVYAPKGAINVLGTGDITQVFNTQLIGYNVYSSGNASIDIRFNGQNNSENMARLDLDK